MRIRYSSHAYKRMKQRGISHIHVLHALKFSSQIRRSYGCRKIAEITIENQSIKVVFIEMETYIKVVTVI
ncbi:DUF4258 domain-containing protein [Nanoarchaeota archaeon]